MAFFQTGKLDAKSIQGNDVLPNAPNDGEALVYSNTDQAWKPTSVSSNPGGADQQVQFNSSGTFGGSANFIWDNSTSTLNVQRLKVGINTGTAYLEPDSSTGYSFLGTYNKGWSEGWIGKLVLGAAYLDSPSGWLYRVVRRNGDVVYYDFNYNSKFARQYVPEFARLDINVPLNPYNAHVSESYTFHSGTDFYRTTSNGTVDLKTWSIGDLGQPTGKPRLQRIKAWVYGYNENSANSDYDSFYFEKEVLIIITPSGTVSIVPGSEKTTYSFKGTAVPNVSADFVLSGTSVILRGTGETGINLIWYAEWRYSGPSGPSV